MASCVAATPACGDDTANNDGSGTTGDDGTDSTPTGGTSAGPSSSSTLTTGESESSGSSGSSGSTASTGGGSESSGGSNPSSGSSSDENSGTSSSDSGTESESSTGDETTGGVVDPPDVQDHGGGEPHTVAFDESYAYLGQGPRVYVWDLSDEGEPTLAGVSEPFDGLVTGIAVHGDHMIVSVNRDLAGEVHVLDLSDPLAPTPVTQIDWTAGLYANPTDVIVDGDILYLSDTENGVFSFDITDPENAVAIDDYTEYGVSDLSLDGGTLRAMAVSFIGGATVTTFSVDQGAFTYEGVVAFGDGTDIAYDGDTAYRSGFFGFSAWDISNPNSAVSLYDDPDQVGWAVATSPGAGYLMADDGVHVFDASGPSIVPGDVVDAAVLRTQVAERNGGDLFAATAYGFGLLFDVGTDPLAPTETAMFELPVGTDPSSVAYAGDLLFVADFYTGVRISRADDWSPVGRFTLPDASGCEDIVVEDDLAYIADWSSGLWIVDVSDPSQPQFRAHVITGGYPSAVELVGNYALIGESTGGGAVVVIDVSDPSDPDIVASVPTSKVRDMALAGDRLLVSDETLFDVGGLRIFDISDPESIAEVGHYTQCDSSLGVARTGHYALLSCSDDVLHVVDIADPDNPVQAATMDTGVYGSWGIGAFGDHAYLSHGLGVLQIDISDPTTPVVIEDRPIAQSVRRFSARADGAVFGAAGQAGVYRVQ